jgi:hypothetical protein
MIFTGCATYNLSSQSMLEQFANTGSEKKVTYLIVPPFVFFPGVVKGNDLRILKCIDKNGNEKIVTVTNRTSVRITKSDNSRTTFYFDTLLLKDSTIAGSKTHFFNAQIKPIKFSDISKIEIQE